MMKTEVYVKACMPAMADVVSGAVARPRARRDGETWQGWIVTTPAYTMLGLAVDDLVALADDHELAELLGEPPALVMLDNYSGNVIAVNVDGTRAAIREVVYG